MKPPKKLKVPKDVVEAEKTKVEVRKDLASSLKFSSQVAPSNDYNVTFPTDAPVLVERANLIGKLVADNLLHWSMLRKRIFNIFFEYEQQISFSTKTSALQPQTLLVFGFQKDTNIY